MKAILAYGILHLSVLTGLTFKIVHRKITLFAVVNAITKTNILHLLHTTFWMYVFCLIAYLYIKDPIGGLRGREQSVLSENLYMYLIDSLLVLSIFSRDICHPNLIIFVIVISLKCIVWVLNVRTEDEPEPEQFWFSSFMCFVSLILAIIFLILSQRKFSIMALFALETGLIAVSHLRNIFSGIIKVSDDESSKPIHHFYVDIIHLTLVFIMYIIFVIVTSMKYKIPLNVFRSAVAVVEKLINKIRVFLKYIKLCKDLDKCEDVKSDSPCPICHDEMETGKLLRCGHVFHFDCLKSWCERQYFCPICRVDISLVPKEVVFFNGDEIISGVPVRLDD